MTYSKIVFLENVIKTPTYENTQIFNIALIASAEKIRDESSHPALLCTIQEMKQSEMAKLMHQYLGITTEREILLDVDVYPEYEFEAMTTSQLENYFSQNDDLKSLLNGKTVMSVTKLKDGFLIDAYDDEYAKELKKHKERVDNDPLLQKLTSELISKKSAEKPTETEVARNTI